MRWVRFKCLPASHNLGIHRPLQNTVGGVGIIKLGNEILLHNKILFMFTCSFHWGHSFLSFCYLFIYCLCPRHVEAPRPGMETGPQQCPSSDPSHCCDNTGSLTHCTTRELLFFYLITLFTTVLLRHSSHHSESNHLQMISK